MTVNKKANGKSINSPSALIFTPLTIIKSSKNYYFCCLIDSTIASTKASISPILASFIEEDTET